MCRQQLMEIKVPEKKEKYLSRSSPSSVKLFCWDPRGAKWPKKASSLVSEGLDLAPFLIIVRVWPRLEVLRCDHKEDDSSILCSNIDDSLDHKKVHNGASVSFSASDGSFRISGHPVFCSGRVVRCDGTHVSGFKTGNIMGNCLKSPTADDVSLLRFGPCFWFSWLLAPRLWLYLL